MIKSSYPKISIITPVLNSINTVEKALLSLLKQNYPNLEFIVFDGGSTDGTIEIIKKYQKHIDYFESKKDRGPNAVYNKGIEKASGDLIAFLNADDWYVENILFKVAKAYHDNPDTDIFSCGFQLVTKQPDQKYKVIQTLTKSDLNIDLTTVIKSGPITNARFIKPNIYKKLGTLNCFDQDGKYLDTADKEFFFRLALANVKYHNLEEIGYISLKHTNSRTHNNHLHIKEKLYKQHLAIVTELSKNHHLNTIQKQQLNNWYAQEVGKLFLIRLLSFKISGTLKITQLVAKQLGTLWPIKVTLAFFLFILSKINKSLFT